MILVDSSVWIDYFSYKDHPHTRKLHSVLGNVEILVPDLVMTEVLQGFRIRKEFDAAYRVLSAFKFVVTGSRVVSAQAARNFVYLRSIGFTVRKTVDTIIATRCILSGYELLHNDKDFLPFEKYLGLRCLSLDN